MRKNRATSFIWMLVRVALGGVFLVCGSLGCLTLLGIPMSNGPVYWPVVAMIAAALLAWAYRISRDV